MLVQDVSVLLMLPRFKYEKWCLEGSGNMFLMISFKQLLKSGLEASMVQECPNALKSPVIVLDSNALHVMTI